MSSGGTGGGGVIIIHNAATNLPPTITRDDLQTIVSSLPDGALKTILENYLASIPVS